MRRIFRSIWVRWARASAPSSTVEAARATAATPLGAHDREGDWVTPAAKETGQAPDLVRQIFDDAVTTGVVIAGPTKYTQPVHLPIEWRWRFPELAAHLASLA